MSVTDGRVAGSVKGLAWKGYEGADYEQFWVGSAKRHLDALERAIVRRTLPGGGAVADVGAGFGRLGASYVQRYGRVHMVEPASNLRRAAEALHGAAATYHDARVEALPFEDGELDAVVMVRVFHHLAEPEAALREIYRVLKPGGRLVFNYSNKRNLRRVVAALARGSLRPFSLEMEQYAEALIGHHPRQVETLLRQLGFRTVEQYGVGFGDKLVGAVPPLGAVLRPSTTLARWTGRLRLAPAQFLVAIKVRRASSSG